MAPRTPDKLITVEIRNDSAALIPEPGSRELEIDQEEKLDEVIGLILDQHALNARVVIDLTEATPKQIETIIRTAIAEAMKGKELKQLREICQILERLFKTLPSPIEIPVKSADFPGFKTEIYAGGNLFLCLVEFGDGTRARKRIFADSTPEDEDEAQSLQDDNTQIEEFTVETVDTEPAGEDSQRHPPTSIDPTPQMAAVLDQLTTENLLIFLKNLESRTAQS